MPLNFGPFDPVFERGELPVPGHLALLNLGDAAECNVVVERIDRALAHPDALESLAKLLTANNWRPHLVAAVAMLRSSNAQRYVHFLWSAVRTGSWVSPQLLATASIVDPKFLINCESRLAESVRISPGAGMSPSDRHSATGPAGSSARSAKELSAILALADRTQEEMLWAEQLRSQADTALILSKDIDDCADIAVYWRKRCVELGISR